MLGDRGSVVSLHGHRAAAVGRLADRRATTLILAAALAAAIFAIREGQPNPNEGVTLLYTIPIALVAIRFGALGGLLAAAASLGLFAIWEQTKSDVEIGAVGYLTRGLAFLVLGGVVGAYSAARRRLIDRLHDLARTDALTGLLNHGAFYAELSRELALGRRYARQCSVMVIDLDGFKQINDRHGHVVGDRVLRRAADQLELGTRDTDVVGRIGGDEFAMLLPETGPSAAEAAEARIVELLAAVELDLPGGKLGVTASVGTATFDGTATVAPREALALADAAMYESKTGMAKMSISRVPVRRAGR